MATRVCRVIRVFPPDERFGLASRMRRAAAAVPADIVKGGLRETEPDYRRFLSIGLGSLRELGQFIGLCERRGCVASEDAPALQEKYKCAARLLSALAKSLGSGAAKPASG